MDQQVNAIKQFEVVKFWTSEHFYMKHVSFNLVLS